MQGNRQTTQFPISEPAQGTYDKPYIVFVLADEHPPSLRKLLLATRDTLNAKVFNGSLYSLNRDNYVVSKVLRF